jgi:hypothetical protein
VPGGRCADRRLHRMGRLGRPRSGRRRLRRYRGGRSRPHPSHHTLRQARRRTWSTCFSPRTTVRPLPLTDARAEA